MTARTAYLLILVPSLLWCVGFLLLPLAGTGGDALAARLYGRVCHQIDERSFAWGSVPWAVCIRCSAIYLGFTAALIVTPLVRGLERWTPLRPPVFAACLVPAVVDAALNLTGLHEADTTTRLVTGTLAGMGLGLAVPPLFIDALQRLFPYRTTHSSGDTDAR